MGWEIVKSKSATATTHGTQHTLQFEYNYETSPTEDGLFFAMGGSNILLEHYTHYQLPAGAKFRARYVDNTLNSTTISSVIEYSPTMSRQQTSTPMYNGNSVDIHGNSIALYIEQFVGTIPSTPDSITVSSSVKVNESFTVSWGVSDGAENYYLERKINNGSFYEIGSGSSTFRSRTETPLSSWNTVQYRVRAGNEIGYSDYKTSSVVNVIHNQPPTRPPTITLPEIIRSGENFLISWGLSTDPDGDPITYKLERWVNSGSYQEIYSGNLRSYTDHAQSSWNNIRYLVKAYDGTDYSEPRVSELRSVVHNQPPTTPLNITIPSFVQSNEYITISWGSSSDPDGDTITYKLERKVNNGYFTEIYSGGLRSISDYIEISWSTVQYRVRAYDELEYSGYRTSEIRTITHNYPPTTPSYITLPSLIYSNTNFNISWGASTDPDGDSISYRLERKINNGSFQLVYNGSFTNYTDTAQISWDTIQYRVKAYDGSDYSGYRTSSITIVKSFPELKIKINNQLKTPEGGWIKIGGQLREIEKIWTKINGQLREV